MTVLRTPANRPGDAGADPPARSEVEDKGAGADAGANDYLAKPFPGGAGGPHPQPDIAAVAAGCAAKLRDLTQLDTRSRYRHRQQADADAHGRKQESEYLMVHQGKASKVRRS